jgi:hypothetical protein
LLLTTTSPSSNTLPEEVESFGDCAFVAGKHQANTMMKVRIFTVMDLYSGIKERYSFQE